MANPYEHCEDVDPNPRPHENVGFMERQYLMYLDMLVDKATREPARPNRTGVDTFGVFGAQMRCDLGREFPLLTTKKVHVKSVITELQWFLRGDTHVSFLQDRGCTIWDEWATAEQCAKFRRMPGDLGPIYGKQWRYFGTDRTGAYRGGFDQIAWLVAEIQKNPTSRRLIVSAWDPRDAGNVALPPCHTMFQCKVEDERLSLHLYMRSCDIFLGLPFNLASYGFLVHALARATNLTPGDQIVSFGDLHLYRNHLDAARTQLAREPKPSPRVHVRPDPIHTPDSALEFLTTDWVADVEGYDPHPAIKAQVAV